MYTRKLLSKLCIMFRKMFKNDILFIMCCFTCGKAEESQLVDQVDMYCNLSACGVSSSVLSQIPIQIESCRMFFITTSVCSQVILQKVLPFLHKNVEWLGKPHDSHISEGWILSLKIIIATTSFQIFLKCFMAFYFCHERCLISCVPKLTKRRPNLDVTAVTGTPLGYRNTLDTNSEIQAKRQIS